jgi:hypothetical protein
MFIYIMDNEIRKFKCMECKKMKPYIICKSSYDNIFRCDLCWKKHDIKLINEALIKLMELKN